MYRWQKAERDGRESWKRILVLHCEDCPTLVPAENSLRVSAVICACATNAESSQKNLLSQIRPQCLTFDACTYVYVYVRRDRDVVRNLRKETAPNVGINY